MNGQTIEPGHERGFGLYHVFQRIIEISFLHDQKQTKNAAVNSA